MDRIRKVEFFSLFPALGILNLGWIVLLRDKIKKQKNTVQIVPLLLISTMGILIWVALMFRPESTTNHQNSYALIMLLFTVLATSIATASVPIRRSVACLQLISFYLVWVYGLYKINGHLYALIPVTGMLLIYCVFALYFIARKR